MIETDANYISALHNGPTAMHLAIFIPAYNEGDTVASAVEALPDTLAGVRTVTRIVIDDGSSDDTAALAERAGATVVRHGRNLGLASAFRSGIRAALELGADIAVSMDADLQFSPDDIPALIEPILAGRAEFVAGDRFPDGWRPQNMPATKYHGNRLMTGLVNRITGHRFSDVSSGYRAYSREALLHLNIQSSFTYTQESFIELCTKGLRIEQVPVDVTYHPQRRSAISGNLLHYAARTFLTIGRTVRDYTPFAVFGGVAGILAIPGILIGLFVVGHYVVTGSFSPYIFLAFTAIYLFTAGLALLVLALVADMLRGLRANQERLLYFEKRRLYGRARTE